MREKQENVVKRYGFIPRKVKGGSICGIVITRHGYRRSDKDVFQTPHWTTFVADAIGEHSI